jgi:site-specific DNA-methyltransferase (adenine-specific)
VTTPAWQLHLGDCAAPEGLVSLPTASVGALITDPPAGIGFMGKEWDGDKGGRHGWVGWLTGIMRECLRVLKPGAHGLVWALPRTSHWTATALEDAGFEIRDVITHHFGTGFPKSLDVSKAIDAAAGAEREVVGNHGRSFRPHADGGNDGWQRPSHDVLGAITAPATPAAKQWAGWGTALKPASEHWILVRKPLDGTVAANVQRHGTGALNIDGSRIAAIDGYAENNVTQGINTARTSYVPAVGRRTFEPSLAGRWPANLVLTHAPDCGETCAPGCPVAELDTQSGICDSHGNGQVVRSGIDYNGGNGGPMPPIAADSGGASRFFYCAKPSRDERDAGCASLPIRSGGEATGRKDGSAALSSPRTGAGRGGGARNDHPTVKPAELMEWLIRLITPPGATLLILDPFAGSGTTGVAAIRLHHGFVGWEREPGYHQIATKRLQAAAAEPEQLGLFGERRTA